MDGLAELAGSTALGAVFGAAGSLGNRALGLVEARARREDRRLEMAHEAELHRLQLKARAPETESELLIAAAGAAAPLDAPEALGGYAWVEAARAMTRPVLTVLLWGVFLAMFVIVLESGLDATTRAEAAATFVQAIAFAATTALVWWFGDRAPERAEARRGREAGA